MEGASYPSRLIGDRGGGRRVGRSCGRSRARVRVIRLELELEFTAVLVGLII